MSEQDDSARAKLARGVVAGVIAGAVAAFAMDRFQAVVSPLLPSSGNGDEEPATEKTADVVATALTGHDIAETEKALGGQIVHYVFGIGLGVAYGIAAEFHPSVTAGYGTGFDIGTATLLDEGLVPAVGLGSPPWKASLGVWSRDEVTRVKFEDVGRSGPGLANRFERRLPPDCLEVLGEVVG